MVCPRCIAAVARLLKQRNIIATHIQLGQVITETDLSPKQLIELSDDLSEAGFELLDDLQSQLVSQIKTLIINQIYYDQNKGLPFTEVLTTNLRKDYSYLSKLFSSIEGISIEQYAIRQRVEHIKELLSYDQLTLSEIAYKMGYSSVAHISAQFKKVTGMTPSQFKDQAFDQRNSIDKI